MEYRIIDANRSKIEAMIKAIQPLAKQRRMTWDDLQAAIYVGNKRLAKIPKKWWPCVRVIYSLNETMPASYKYIYQADVAVLRWNKAGKCWNLVSVRRRDFWPTERDRSSIQITDLTAVTAIRDHLLVQFCRI